MGGGKRRRNNSDRKSGKDDKRTKKESDFVATHNTVFESKKDSNDNTELGAQSKDSIDPLMADTCNWPAVFNFLRAVGEDLLEWSEDMLTRGLNEQKIIAVIDPDRKLEDNFYQQMRYHLRETPGPLIEQRASGNNPIRFLVEWKLNQVGKYPENIVSEQLDEIFSTFETEKFKTIAHKGQRILSLVNTLAETLKAIYQIPTKKTEGMTEFDGVPTKDLRKKWEEMGPVIEAEFSENLRAIGLSTDMKIAELDMRASRVLVDQANHEIVVPIDTTNDFGHPKRRNLSKKINQLVVQLQATQSVDHSENERLQLEVIIEMLKGIQNMENGPTKDVVIQEYIGVIYELINEAVIPEGENQLLLSMNLEQLRGEYTKNLLNAYDRMGAEEYKQMLGQVEELAKLVEEAIEKNTMSVATVLAVEKNLPSGRNTRSNTDDDAKSQEMDGWTACGFYETMLVKVDLVDVSPGDHGDKLLEDCVFRRVKFLRLNVQAVDVIIRGLVMSLEDLVDKIRNHEVRMASETGVPYSLKHIEKLLNEKSKMEKHMSEIVEEIMAVQREISLGCQLQLRHSQIALGLLDKTTDEKTCWVILVETTQKTCDEYAGLTGRCLPKVLKPSTFNALQRAAKAMVSIKRFRLGYRICQEMATVKFIWKANLVMKMSVVRHAEEKAKQLSKEAEEPKRANKHEEISKRDLEKLVQCEPIIDELLRNKNKPTAPRRFSPCPETMEDEELEDLDEEDKENLKKFLNNYNTESYEVYMKERTRPTKKVGSLLKRLLNEYYIAMSDDVYHDIPVEYMPLCPTTGKERISFLEAQDTVSFLRDLESRVIANRLIGVKNVETPKEPLPKEEVGLTKARAKLRKMGVIVEREGEEVAEEENPNESPFKGELSDYPGLEDIDEPSTILVITQVRVEPCHIKEGGNLNERDAILTKWCDKLPAGSFGEAITNHEKIILSEDRKLSKERSYHTAQGVCQNSDFSTLGESNSCFIETNNSCGMDCPPKSKRCLSRKPGILAQLRKEHSQYEAQCALEWYRRVKDNTTLDLVQTMLKGMINFNGDQTLVREGEVENKEKHITHNIIKVTVPCVVLTRRLVPSVTDDMEFLAAEPGLLTVYYPEKYGDADEEPTLRPVRMIQNGLIHIPRFLLPMVWAASNCLIGVNLTDERTATPRYQVLNMCKICAKTYLSPVSLLLHLLYEEMVLGDVNETSGSHEDCGKHALCICRLVKKAAKSNDENENSKQDQRNKKKCEKSFDSNSYVQLKILESVDVSLMRIEEMIDVMILCNQIGLMTFIPGGSFGQRWNLTVQDRWQLIPIWGNLYQPIIKCNSNESQSFLSENWKMEKYSNTRMCPNGRPIEVGIREMGSQLVERSQNIRSSSARFASVGNQGMTRDINPRDPKFAQIKLLKDRVEDLEFLEKFLPVHEDILSQNVIMSRLPKVPVEEEPEDYLRRMRIYRLVVHLYHDRSEVHKLRLPSLAKTPIEEGKFSDKNLFDTIIGPMIGASPNRIAREAFEIDLNCVKGEQIVPGKKLVFKVPKTKLEPGMNKVLAKISKKEAKIYEQGWESDGRPKKLLSIESAIKKEFVPAPTVEELEAAREEELRKKRKESEINNNEGKAFQRSKWKCGVCARALMPLKEHRNGCYLKVCSKEQRKADKEIEKICDDNKRKRLAKEMEEKEVIVETKNEEKPIEEGASKNISISQTQESPRRDIISNETIKKLDREVDDNHAELKLSNEDEHGVGGKNQKRMCSLVGPAKSILKAQVLKRIEEESLDDDEERDKKCSEMEETGNAIKAEDMFVYERTAQQVESDDVVRDLILLLEDTNDPMEQMQLARLIHQEARSVGLAVSQMEDVNIDYNAMDGIDEPSEDEEDDEDADGRHSNVDYDDMNAIEEPSESEEDDDDDSVKDDDDDDNMDAVETADNDLADDWCYGGYDEDTGDLIQCGKSNCKNCS